MIDIKDEILSGDPRYRIRDNNGNILQDNISIEQITHTVQEPTSINKVLFQNMYNETMQDTRNLIVDYTLEEDAQQVTIDGLDLEADGGIYDIVLTGSSSTSYMGMRINNIEEAIYYVQSANNDYSNETFWRLGGYNVKNMFLAKVSQVGAIVLRGDAIQINANGEVSVNTNSRTDYFAGGISGETVNSITFLSSDSMNPPSPSGNIKAGFNVKIYKRR